jgi:hypothetical protein
VALDRSLREDQAKEGVEAVQRHRLVNGFPVDIIARAVPRKSLLPRAHSNMEVRLQNRRKTHRVPLMHVIASTGLPQRSSTRLAPDLALVGNAAGRVALTRNAGILVSVAQRYSAPETKKGAQK